MVAGKRVSIHSHNDYDQERPFWGAYEAGAASIEADIWLVDGEIYVAHNRKDIRPERTLEALYLSPIRQVLPKGGRSFQLLVDLKTGPETLDSLIALIEREGMRKYFDRSLNPRAVQIVITGNKVKPQAFSSYPEYVLFDGVPDAGYNPEQLKRVPLISETIRKYSRWKGVGKMSREDRRKISQAVREAHRQGCLFRLWGFPDMPQAWKLSLRLGLDYINTDHPAQVAEKYNKPE